MALAKVPLVPQWNLSNGCAATPDGGFLYIGSKTINYISKIKIGAPPLIKVFHMRQAILSLAVDPAWSADDASKSKHFAVLAQDSCVQIWDFDKGCAISAHKGHISRLSMEGNAPHTYDKVLLSYMSNRNVLSISSYEIVIYCVASNSFCRRPTFISTRTQQITVLRCSPYNEHIFAVGTSRGLVLVCDLQQMGIIYTLRGHEAPITALSWTIVQKEVSAYKEAPTFNEKPRLRNNSEKVPFNLSAAAGDDIFDIYDYDYLENEFGAPTNASKGKNEAPEFVGLEMPVESATTNKFDFVEACLNLKEEINAMKHQDDQKDNNEVTLFDCQHSENKAELSSSCGEEDSTEGSLELVYRSSDDDLDVDGAEPKLTKSLAASKVIETQRIVHKAEVHCTQSQEKTITHATEELGPQAVKHAVTDQQGIENSDNLSENEGNTSEQESDILLASASNDATFSIWNTKTGAACDQIRARGAGKHGKNLNIEIVWLKSTSFLITNRLGEITLWNLLPSESKIKRYKFKEEKAQFLQRGVVAFTVCLDNEIIWTISSNREIACENILSKQMVAKYCCASTNISAMRECPDDMNKIALGFSDRRVGIIDISKFSATNVSIENFTIRIESPVLSLVWSPDNKKLAFGTIEGTIGIIHVENSKLQPFTYHPFCGKPIYSVDWKEHYIFAVCNEKLGVYEDNMINKDAFVLQSVPNVSAISVRNEFLFVGTQRGHLQVYRRRTQSKLAYDLIQDLELAPRYITEIAWSPIASEQFAVISMANKIHILNFDAATSANPSVTHVRKIEIKNPKTANACVKWSNRNKNELMTCGFDGAVRIWDLNSGSDDEKFLKQYPCPMTCGLFLPTDENIIICAGKSTSVEMFNMIVEKSEDYSQTKWLRLNANHLEHVQWAIKMKSHTEAKLPSTNEKRRNRRGKGKGEENDGYERGVGSFNDTIIEVNDNESCEMPTNGNTKEDISRLMNNLQIAAQHNDGDISKPADNVHKCGITCGTSPFMKNPATLLYLTTKEINKDALEKLNFILSKDPCNQLEKSILTAKLFSKKCDARELLEEELRNHQNSETKGIASLLMPQMQANIKEEILKCIQNKQLTEWHVSLAPSISYNFWQKCCHALAEQLMEQGLALQAATYMSAIHNQTEAIQMLIEKNYFKEALLIGRVYLQSDDPLLNTITDKWISYLDFTGNLAGAALLCTLSGQMNRAYETLSKVRNVQPDVEKALQLLKNKNSFSSHKSTQ